MVVKYFIKKCPHCGKEIERQLVNIDKMVYWGSPVRTCKHCKETYIDRRYHELALGEIPYPTYQEPEKETAISALILLAITAGCIALLIGAIAWFGIILYVLIIVPMFCMWQFFSLLRSPKKKAKAANKDFIKRKQEYDVEFQQSVERMQNSQYVQMLKSLGYTVPMCYDTGGNGISNKKLNCQVCGEPYTMPCSYCSKCGNRIGE